MPDELVQDVRSRLAGKRFDTADHVIVLDGTDPVGTISMENLLAFKDGQRVDEVMIPNPPTVTEDTDQEVAAHLMVDARAGLLIVVGSAGQFRGVITPESMLAVLLSRTS